MSNLVMEPKVIKEETVEKEASSYVDSSAPVRIKTKITVAGGQKERCKTPDSPEGGRLSQAAAPSPTQSSPVRTPANGSTSPVQNGSTDSLTPPPASSAAGLAALSLNLGVEGAGLTSGPWGSHGHQQPPHRPQLSKLKRFLSTLLQFGQDISPDVGDRVRSLIFSLVSSNLSVEEFHHSLQDVTNFPLRPFVLPFLRAHLPMLQREILALARASKQNPLQYLRAHDHLVFETAHSPAEPSEIFLSTGAETPTVVKRRASDALYENGVLNGGQHLQGDGADYPPCAKRPCNIDSEHQLLSLGLRHLLGNSLPPQQLFPDYKPGHPPGSGTNHTAYQRPVGGSEETADEWRNIHVMLNCILSMVEKTKRALSILQSRSQTDWYGTSGLVSGPGGDLKKAAAEIMAAAVRQTEERVAEVRRKAEDAVNEVKRGAVLELQKAVQQAELRASELVQHERAKMEKLLIEARKSHSDESHGSVADCSDGRHSPTSQTLPGLHQNCCWNCGRKAHETCSGCSVARYCGPFCQHKDWENHHQVCNATNRDKLRPHRTPSAGTTTTTISAVAAAAAVTPPTVVTTPVSATAAAVATTALDSARLKK